jgi:hypothetical protein
MLNLDRSGPMYVPTRLLAVSCSSLQLVARMLGLEFTTTHSTALLSGGKIKKEITLRQM